MDEQSITTLDDLAGALAAADSQPETEQEAEEQGEQQEQVETSNEAEAEGEESEAEAAEQEAGQAQAPADDAVIKWETANGEAFEAPISELKAGYMRSADYTQKTQALAEERKAAEVEVSKRFEEVTQFAREQAQLMQVHEQLEKFAKADWNALYAENAAEAGRLHAQWQQLKDHAQQLSRNYQAKHAQMREARSKQFQEQTKAALETLERDIPNFGRQHLDGMRDAGLAHGFTDEELGAVSDPRMFKVLHDAAQWRALQAKKPSVQQQVKAAPTKAVKPGASAPDKPSTQLERAQRSFAQKKDVRSLAAMIAATE